MGKVLMEVLVNVLVYPQCYAAVAGMLPTFGKKALVIDVGSWTVDSMLIVNKKPDNSRCDTQNEGLIIIFLIIRSTDRKCRMWLI